MLGSVLGRCVGLVWMGSVAGLSCELIVGVGWLFWLGLFWVGFLVWGWGLLRFVLAVFCCWCFRVLLVFV